MAQLLQHIPGKITRSQMQYNGLDLFLGPVYGNVIFVQSSHDRADDGSSRTGFDQELPFGTLKAAILTAEKWDKIIVGPGHTESIDADDDWAWQDVGQEVIGVGFGAERPTFTFDTTTAAAIILDTASTVLRNLLFISGIDDLTDPLQVNAADCGLFDIEYRDASAKETIDVLWLKSGATRFIVDGIKIVGNSGGNSGQSAIHIDGADDGLLTNFDLYGDYQTGVIENVGDEALNIRILGGDGRFIGGRGSRIWTTAPEDLAIVMDAAATGYLEGPISVKLADNAANIDECVLPGNLQVYNKGGHPIEVVNLIAESSIVWPGTASTDA